MPRVTEQLFARAKHVKSLTNTPATLWVKFKDRPAVLRDFVPSKKDKAKGRPCLQELSVMFSCWENHEFETRHCSKEIESFNNCLQQYNVEQQEKAVKDAKGLFDNSGKLTSKQVNSVLAKYPTRKT